MNRPNLFIFQAFPVAIRSLGGRFRIFVFLFQGEGKGGRRTRQVWWVFFVSRTWGRRVFEASRRVYFFSGAKIPAK